MNLKKNVYLFYAINFFQACIFAIPIRYFFFINYLHFWIGDAILIRTLSWLFELFFEVPSWWWADRYGRKKVFILWLFSLAFWFSFYLYSQDFYLFLFSSMFIWLWYSLTSWNLEALIHDNLEEDWKWAEYDKIQSNQYIFMYLWRATSSLVAGYLFFFWALFPYIATIICIVIATIFALLLHSPKQELSHETSDFNHLKKALVFLYARKNLVLVIFFLGFIISWFWNVYWFTYQPYLEKIWLDIKDIWIIYFFISLFSAIWSYIIKHIKIKIDTFSILRYMLWGLFLISLMFNYFDNLLWVIPILLLSVWFGFVMIVWNTYLIKVSPKTHKSTILSIFALSVSLWYFVLWTTAGYIAQAFSLEVLYTILPIILFSFLILFILLSRKLEVKK